MKRPSAYRAAAVKDPNGTFTALRLAIGWDRVHLGRRLGVDEKQIRRWEEGAAVPPAVLDWLLDLLTYLARHPPPQRPFSKDPQP